MYLAIPVLSLDSLFSQGISSRTARNLTTLTKPDFLFLFLLQLFLLPFFCYSNLVGSPKKQSTCKTSSSQKKKKSMRVGGI